MSTVHKLLMTAVAATLFTAAGASAAVSQTNAPSFERTTVQERGYSGLDRHECRSLKTRNLRQPAYCIYR